MQDRKIHRENPTETLEIGSSDLAAAQPRQIVAEPACGLDRAPIRRRADVPLANTGRIREDSVSESLLRARGAKHAFRRRRTTNVAEADE
jgi:hypothetical protein